MARKTWALLPVAGVLFLIIAPGQANPIIIELVKGVIYGVGASAGKELYDTLRNRPSTDATVFRPPAAPPHSPRPKDHYPASTPTSHSGSFSMRMSNQSGMDVSIQFYSLARKDYEWPADGRAYLLASDRETEIHFKCALGEMICYGAWSERKVWGVGHKFRQTCERCCQFCGSTAAGVSLW